MKKVLLIFESRASYGYSKNLYNLLKMDKNFKIKTLVTGTHLSKELGSSVSNFSKDKIKIDYKINFENKNFAYGIGKLTIEFSKILKNYKPNIVIIFGDRVELMSFAIGCSYNQNILLLTKIFSLCAIFSCASHLLITKFEASKTLNKNLKLEFSLMPFFLVSLYYLTSNKFSLIEISYLILFKEVILLLLRLNLLKKIIENVIIYYLYIISIILALYISINFENLFFIMLIFLIIGNFINND